MKREEIEAIKQREKAATPGEWTISSVVSYKCWDVSSKSGSVAAELFCLTDAKFIAASRTDVPALVAEVEELRELFNRLDGIMHSSGYTLDECADDISKIIREALGDE